MADPLRALGQKIAARSGPDVQVSHMPDQRLPVLTVAGLQLSDQTLPCTTWTLPRQEVLAFYAVALINVGQGHESTLDLGWLI